MTGARFPGAGSGPQSPAAASPAELGGDTSGLAPSLTDPQAGPAPVPAPGPKRPIRLRGVVAGGEGRRMLGRLTLRQKLLAVGAAGIVLTLVLVELALIGFGSVNHADDVADRLSQVQSFHQDADMQHDALHSDVYLAVATSGGQAALSRDQVLADLADHASRFQRDIDGAGALSVPPPVSRAVSDVRASEERYIAAAQKEGVETFTDRGAALAALGSFEQQFRDLVGPLGDVTVAVSGAAARAQADARDEIGRRHLRILVSSSLALAGLFAIAVMLNRVGKTLAESLGEVEAHIEALEGSEQRSRDFLAYAAHQLRTPISNTRASAEALLLGGASPDQEALLSGLVHETGRAGRLVTSLLRMSRLDQGEVPATGPCDVMQLCQQELERIEARAPSLRWVLEVDGPVPPRVELAPEATAEALANLLDNAARHAQTNVTVRLSMAGEGLRISVHDDGPGLPQAAWSSAFERLVSLDGYGGSGLGLPIARALAEAQGGRLDYVVDSFVMTLPVTEIEAGSAS